LGFLNNLSYKACFNTQLGSGNTIGVGLVVELAVLVFFAFATVPGADRPVVAHDAGVDLGGIIIGQLGLGRIAAGTFDKIFFFPGIEAGMVACCAVLRGQGGALVVLAGRDPDCGTAIVASEFKVYGVGAVLFKKVVEMHKASLYRWYVRGKDDGVGISHSAVCGALGAGFRLPDTLLAEGPTTDRQSAFRLSFLLKAVSSIEVQCQGPRKRTIPIVTLSSLNARGHFEDTVGSFWLSRSCLTGRQ